MAIEHLSPCFKRILQYNFVFGGDSPIQFFTWPELRYQECAVSATQTQKIILIFDRIGYLTSMNP